MVDYGWPTVFVHGTADHKTALICVLDQNKVQLLVGITHNICYLVGITHNVCYLVGITHNICYLVAMSLSVCVCVCRRCIGRIGRLYGDLGQL